MSSGWGEEKRGTYVGAAKKGFDYLENWKREKEGKRVFSRKERETSITLRQGKFQILERVNT